MPLSAEQIAGLVDRYAVPLQLFAQRRCAAAEDVVQEAFCRLAVLKEIPDRPVAWLYRVVRNLAESQRISRKRREAREAAVAVAEAFHVKRDDVIDVDEALRAVSKLDDALRDIVTARIWGQLTFEEIGELCGVSTATASRRYREALEQIRKTMRITCPTSNQ